MKKYTKKISILMLLYLGININLKAEITIQANETELIATNAFLKGNDASIRGDTDSAIKYLNEAIEMRPDNNYLKRKLSIEYIKKGELENAEKILEKIVNESSFNDYISGNLLAGVYLAVKKPLLATMTYKKLIQQNSMNEKTTEENEELQEACEHIAKSFSSKIEFNKDKKIFKRCEVISKNDAIYKFYRGKIEYELGKYISAKKYLKDAMQIDPKLFQAALVLGIYYEQKGHRTEAVKTYKNFLAKYGNENNIPIISRLVHLLFAMKKDNEANKYLGDKQFSSK
jgi:tetratricopeptide (TPR) repeat protein